MWISFSITNPEIRLTALLDRVVLPKGPVIFLPQTQTLWVSSPNRSPPHRKSSQMPGAPAVLPVFLSMPRCSSFLLVLHQPELAWSEKPVWLDCLTGPVGTKQESPRHHHSRSLWFFSVKFACCQWGTSVSQWNLKFTGTYSYQRLW